MTTTVAAIAKKAFDAAAAAVDGVVHDGIYLENGQGAYDPSSGQYRIAPGNAGVLRFLVEDAPQSGLIGTYAMDRDEQVILVEGLSSSPVVGAAIGSGAFRGGVVGIRFVENIGLSGGLYRVVVK